MRTIYKYPITLEEDFDILMPVGAQFLTVQTQGEHGAPQMWWEVNTANPITERHSFRVYGTGWQMNPDAHLRYLGTFQQENGRFVWHLYETVSPL